MPCKCELKGIQTTGDIYVAIVIVGVHAVMGVEDKPEDVDADITNNSGVTSTEIIMVIVLKGVSNVRHKVQTMAIQLPLPI